MIDTPDGYASTLSDDAISEQAYLVTRGVRSLALLGEEPITDRHQLMRLLTRLRSLSDADGAISFVCDHGDGVVGFGYAAHQWVIDLYRWAMQTPEDVPPSQHRQRILGLLLGYAASAIRDFEARGSGKLFSVRYGFFVACTKRHVTALWQ
jgi:hypothetical protein